MLKQQKTLLFIFVFIFKKYAIKLNKIFTLSCLMFLFSFSSEVLAEQSNFNRSNVTHSYTTYGVEGGYERHYGLGVSHRGLLTLQYDTVKNPYIIVDNKTGDRLFEIVKNMSRLRLGLGYYLRKNIYFGLSVPMDKVESITYNPGSNLTPTQAQSIVYDNNKTLLGDIDILFKFPILFWSDVWNWTVVLQATFPTGDETQFNTDDSIGFGGKLAFNRYFGKDYRWRFYGNVGYRRASNSRLELSSSYTSVDTSDRIDLGLGVAHKLFSKLDVFGEVGGFFALPFSDGQNPADISVGANLRFTNIFSLYAGAGLESLFGDNFSNDFRAFAGLKLLFGSMGKKSKKSIVTGASVTQELVDNTGDITAQAAPAEQVWGKPQVQTIEKTVMYKPDYSEFEKYAKQSGIKLGSQSLDKLYIFRFYSGSEKIRLYDRNQFLELSEIVKAHKDKIHYISIEAHTDTNGDPELNQVLSAKRAEQVKLALIDSGVPSDLLRLKAFGESKPLNNETDSYERFENRRVLVYIVKNSGLGSKFLPKDESYKKNTINKTVLDTNSNEEIKSFQIYDEKNKTTYKDRVSNKAVSNKKRRPSSVLIKEYQELYPENLNDNLQSQQNKLIDEKQKEIESFYHN